MEVRRHATILERPIGGDMASLVLASALSRWLPASAEGETALDLPGESVGEVLDGLFARHPALRGYVLDELGRLRHHVAVFVDGEALPRRDVMARPLRKDASVHLMQALSGG